MAHRPLLSLLFPYTTLFRSSSDGPVEMLVAQLEIDFKPQSSRTVWSAPLLKLGRSLTGVTVMVKVCAALVSTPPLAVPPSSRISTVTVAMHLALASGVYVRM